MIEEAIDKYDFINPTPRFVRHNENMTYVLLMITDNLFFGYINQQMVFLLIFCVLA